MEINRNNLPSAVIKLAEGVHSEVVGWRRQFHQNPEASLKEYNTSSYVKGLLDQWGIEWIPVGETGVLGKLRGALPGNTIALRADMDALELNDLKTAEYASKNQGLCHACGHDAHTAALLGTARILSENLAALPGTVYLIFQQAEEIGAGARQFVSAGVLSEVEEFYGIHVSSDLPANIIGVTPGPQNASCDLFKIRITGSGAHAATPHEGNDALIATAAIASQLQNIVARQTDPMDSLVVSLGIMSAGTRFNVIAQDGYLEGTVRAHDQKLRERVLLQIEETAKLVAKVNRCSAEFSNYNAANPLFNDQATSLAALDKLSRVFDKDQIITGQPAKMGAEDFADYVQDKPGTFIRVGTGGAQYNSYPHHNGNFDIDESALKTMVAVHLTVALDR